MEKIAILTDSSSGWTPKTGLKKGIFVVPLLLNFGDEKSIIDDNEAISETEFYKRIIEKKQIVKTSHSTLGQLMAVFDDLLKTYDKIVFMPISKGLSSQYALANQIVHNNSKYHNKIYVLDTDGVAQQLQVMVLEVQTAVKNGTPIDQLQAIVDYMKQHNTSLLIPDDLTMLVRGGRITPAVALLANALKIKPILRMTSIIDKEGKTRTLKRAVKNALQIIKAERNLNNCYFYFVWSQSSKENRLMVEKLITSELPGPIHKDHLPTVIAAHTGPNSFVIIAIETPIKIPNLKGAYDDARK